MALDAKMAEGQFDAALTPYCVRSQHRGQPLSSNTHAHSTTKLCILHGLF